MGHAEFIEGGRYLVRLSERGAVELVDVACGERRRVLAPLAQTEMRDMRDRSCVEERRVWIANARGEVFEGDLDAGTWASVLRVPPVGQLRRTRVAASGEIVAASHERSFDYKADDAVLLLRNPSGQVLVNLGEWVEVLALRISGDRVECILASHRWEYAHYVSVDLEGAVREEAEIETEMAPYLAHFVREGEFVLLSGDSGEGDRTRVSLHSLGDLPGTTLLALAEDVGRFARTFAVRRTLDGRLQITTFSNGQLHLVTLEGDRAVHRESMPADGVFRATLAPHSDHLYLDAIVKSDSDIRALGERSGMCILARAANETNEHREEPMSPSSYFPPRMAR